MFVRWAIILATAGMLVGCAQKPKTVASMPVPPTIPDSIKKWNGELRSIHLTAYEIRESSSAAFAAAVEEAVPGTPVMTKGAYAVSVIHGDQVTANKFIKALGARSKLAFIADGHAVVKAGEVPSFALEPRACYEVRITKSLSDGSPVDANTCEAMLRPRLEGVITPVEDDSHLVGLKIRVKGYVALLGTIGTKPGDLVLLAFPANDPKTGKSAALLLAISAWS